MGRCGRPRTWPCPSVLIDGQGWELVAEGFTFTEGPAVDPQGNLYFTDVFKSKIHRLGDADGKPKSSSSRAAGTNGLMFGPDGRLYGCQNGKKRIVAYDSAGKDTHDRRRREEQRPGRQSPTAAIYFTDPENHQVWYIAPKGEKRVVDRGLGFPNGLILWPDQGTLVVADMQRRRTCGPFAASRDGSLTFKQPYLHHGSCRPAKPRAAPTA